MLKNNVTTFIHTQHLGVSIELNDGPAEAVDGFVKQKRDIRFAEVIIPWHEVAAVITGNQMSQAPDVEGFCVESGGVTPGKRIVVFDGTIQSEPSDVGNFTTIEIFWPNCVAPDRIYVTFDGQTYTLPFFYVEEMDIRGYGDATQNGPVFDRYPLCILAPDYVYTESAGIYDLKIEMDDCGGGGPK